MRICINFSINSSGGGGYHAIKFVKEYLNEQRTDFYFIFNNKIQLDKWPRNYIIVESPARSFKSKKIIRDYIKINSITTIYTMAGPSYVNFKGTHILGLSNAWLLRSNSSLLFKLYSPYTACYEYLRIFWQRYNINRNAKIYIFQSNESLNLFNEEFPFMRNKSVVIENAHVISSEKLQNETENIIVIGSSYQHKGVYELYSYLTRNMSEYGGNVFNFYVSEKEWDVLIKRYGTNSSVVNKGLYKPSEEAVIMSRASCVILPSYLETVSGSAITAGAIGAKVIARNKNFNKAVFGDSAEYFDSYVELIDLISKDLVQSRLFYPVLTYAERYNKILNLVEELCVE
jgi:hypothetical protein